MHPDRDAIMATVRAEQIRLGKTPTTADRIALASAKLGRPFYQYEPREHSYLKVRAAAFADWNVAHGRSAGAAVPRDVRERIRTEVAERMFTEERAGRRPARASCRAGSPDASA
jgi:hypothetical protein